VDTLSFSTAVATALHHGVVIYPSLPGDSSRVAAEVGADVAVRRADVPERGCFSLSPATYGTAVSGTRVVLASPNGAACCLMGSSSPCVVAASLVNARAAASFVGRYLSETGLSATILACGERWLTTSPGEEIRFAIEDYLGAGAILSYLDLDKSAEALVCEGGFRATSDRLEATLLNCGSGKELAEKGYMEDVLHAARINRYDVVPILESGRFIDGRWSPRPQRG
jgi:2-phosphosulfolactate phosphatase